MILMIDNYDSFTYNLVQYLGELGENLTVVRNDELTVDGIEKENPQAIVLSPGPGTPREAGICLDVVKHLSGKIPILGVCLGHQTIAEAFGGEVIRAGRLMHGKTSEVLHDGETIFSGLPSPVTMTRYHSLIVNPDRLPEELVVSAKTAEGEIMGIRHRFLPVEGVQFHPEAILSEHGKTLLANFLQTYVKQN
ncbi:MULTISPECIES: aminodeoxychorismate/anthranilate synthase component II [unclassified Thermoactinomyces]|jgi:anthranilate synthase/aminodeoxychorismate synthase-like glutamine amidotransferase|uniref:anthranilate synthase component II n=1 Tax=unclassified Thermoactinomyces TaxID=2634588 RepID=UPI0018DCB1FD|nr:MULTISPECIES: aminodeoxychorismate/anthranilate synthase component II [unclassified Thermoactinomyces]MBH8598785.1 aminodeoxychorismate/anthranilate synthase component II [Thermoactinomyces sp. CICC 10523]MBH8607404.1 aminodeoxychorismate/anthranilate synthase component II [Thermoactinomyces sp. CICC 10521]